MFDLKNGIRYTTKQTDLKVFDFLISRFNKFSIIFAAL